MLPETSGQRRHDLREVVNGLHRVVKTGVPWPRTPNDLSPWKIVHQQAQRWLAAGVFEALGHDLRLLLRLEAGRPDAGAAVADSRTLHPTTRARPPGGLGRGEAQEGREGARRLEHARPPPRSPPEGHRVQLGEIAEAVREITGQTVEIAFAGGGCTGAATEAAVAEHGTRL